MKLRTRLKARTKCGTIVFRVWRRNFVNRGIHKVAASSYRARQRTIRKLAESTQSLHVRTHLVRHSTRALHNMDNTSSSNKVATTTMALGLPRFKGTGQGPTRPPLTPKAYSEGRNSPTKTLVATQSSGSTRQPVACPRFNYKWGSATKNVA